MSAERWATLLRQFADASAARGLSPATVEVRERGLRRFIAWCVECELTPEAITLPILERIANAFDTTLSIELKPKAVA